MPTGRRQAAALTPLTRPYGVRECGVWCSFDKIPWALSHQLVVCAVHTVTRMRAVLARRWLNVLVHPEKVGRVVLETTLVSESLRRGREGSRVLLCYRCQGLAERRRHRPVRPLAALALRSGARMPPRQGRGSCKLCTS